MANTDLTQVLTKGTLLIIEHGEYSDKSWQGPVRLLADYTKSDLSDQFLREWEHEDWPCANEFLPWLSEPEELKASTTSIVGIRQLQRLPAMTFAEEVWQRRTLLMKIARYDEDLVQETVYTALRNEIRFHKGTNLNGWLVTILKNLRNTRHKKYRLELQMPEFALDSRTVNPVGSARTRGDGSS